VSNSLYSGSGPALTAVGTPLVVGVDIGVSEGGVWLYSYRWWVPTGGDTESGQLFCLYQITGTDSGTLIPNSTATGGTLTADAWNVIPLPSPLLLAPSYNPPLADDIGTTYGAAYMACTGKQFVNGFPEAKSVFGSGDPDSGGITSGPLYAFSSLSGTNPAGSAASPQWIPQCPYTTELTDPTAGMPTQNDTDANLGMDVVVDTIAPAGASYRMLPNAPVFVVPGVSAQEQAYTLGLAFTLSEACTLDAIWHYSPSGSTVLPSRCGIWNANTQTQVSGTDNSSPSWSGAAGSGWVSCSYSGPVLPAGEYVVSTFTSAETSPWFLAQVDWWDTAFPSGITAGPVEFTGTQYHLGNTWTYPATTGAEFDGLDVQVTPSSSAAAGAGGVAGVADDEMNWSKLRFLGVV